MLEEEVAIEERLRPRDHPLKPRPCCSSRPRIAKLAICRRRAPPRNAASPCSKRRAPELSARVRHDRAGDDQQRDGRILQALSVAEQAVACSERVTSPTSTLTASALRILAAMHARLGDHVSAVIHGGTRGEAVDRADPESLHVATTLMALAESYWALGRMDEAFAAVERALAMKSLQNEPMYLERAPAGPGAPVRGARPHRGSARRAGTGDRRGQGRQ